MKCPRCINLTGCWPVCREPAPTVTTGSTVSPDMPIAIVNVGNNVYGMLPNGHVWKMN